MTRRLAVAILAVVAGATQAGSAQWLHHPTPGTPRVPDGQPNLSARAPRVNGKPDLSGVWQAEGAPIPELIRLLLIFFLAGYFAQRWDVLRHARETRPKLAAYRARLLQHPIVARVVDEARPYRPYFPLGAPDRD